jgi:hypothetical protein
MQVVTGLTIYLQESPRYRSGGGSEDTSCWFDSDQAAKSLYEAKRSGAAAWNFHTRAGMTLNGTFSGYSFYDNLVAGDKEEDFVTADLAATLSCSGSGCPTADLHATCSAPEPDTMAGRVNRTPLGWLRHHMRDGAHPLHPERD